MDQRSYDAQEQASRATSGLVPHPLVSPPKFNWSGTPLEAALNAGQTTSGGAGQTTSGGIEASVGGGTSLVGFIAALIFLALVGAVVFLNVNPHFGEGLGQEWTPDQFHPGDTVHPKGEYQSMFYDRPDGYADTHKLYKLSSADRFKILARNGDKRGDQTYYKILNLKNGRTGVLWAMMLEKDPVAH